MYGSAFPRIMLFSFISAGLTALLYYYPGRDYFYKIWGQHGHPYVYNNLGFIIGFILVFRSNFAYARFVTGRNQLQAMSAHWVRRHVSLFKFGKKSEANAQRNKVCRHSISICMPGEFLPILVLFAA